MNKHTFLLLLLGLIVTTLNAIEPPLYKKVKENKFVEDWIVLGAMPLYEEDSVRRAVVETFLSKHIFTDTIITYPIVVGFDKYEWQPIKADNGIVKLSELYEEPNQKYCYALMVLEMKDSLQTTIGFGSDDDASIWHNNTLIHQVCKGRRVKVDDDLVPVSLQKGRNTFLIRVDNRSGSWGFQFRFIDKATETKARQTRIFDPYKKYDPVMLARDVAILQGYLKDIHPGYDRYISETAFDAMLFGLQKEIALGDSLTIKQFLNKVLPVLARIKDSHTMLWPDEKYFLYDYKYAPFKLRYINETLFIEKLFDYKLHSFQYAEVLELNGMSTDEFIKRANEIIPRDGNCQSTLSANIGDYSILNLLCNLILMDTDEINIVCKTKTNEIDTLYLHEFSSCNAKYITPKSKTIAQPMSYSINDSLGYCTLIMNTFHAGWIKSKGINYEKALKSLFKKLDEEEVKNLVIDLRHNNGGNQELATEFMSYFIKEDYSYFSGLTLNKSFFQKKYLESESVKEIGGRTGYLKYFSKAWVHKMIFNEKNDQFSVKAEYVEKLTQIEPSKYSYSGNIYVLINGRTTDVASDFCAMLRKNTDAVFIGQETGGAQEGSSGGFYFPLRLPTSSCRIWIPAVRMDINTSAHEKGRGTMPDYPVHESLEHVKIAEDPILLKVQSLIQSGQ